MFFQLGVMLLPVKHLSVAVLAVAGPVLSGPVEVRSPYAVKESISIPKGWSYVAPAPANHLITLQIGLRQARFDELERQLFEGKYFSSTHARSRPPEPLGRSFNPPKL